MRYSDRHISDEELDQLFRDAHASEGQEALFVPEFWSEMEAMLPTEAKKKRGFYWIPLAAAAVLIAMILFYPGAPAKIEPLVGKNEHMEDNGSLSERSATDRYHGQNKENTTGRNTQASESMSNKSKLKTNLKKGQRNAFSRYDPDQLADFRVQYLPPVPVELVEETPEANSNPLPTAVGTVSPFELDSLNLQARYETVPQEEILAMPKQSTSESNEWYVELGPTLGQSPYLSPDQKRNAVGGAVLGGGYTKRIDNAFVSFGLQARMEGFGGLEYRETNFSPNIIRTVSVKQLYSLEIPLKFGYTLRRSEFALSVTPGLQLFLHGKERITENQVLQRESNFTGKVEHSNSLTMEFGLQYYYNFTPRFSLGAKLNADILRPFHTDYYIGKSAGLPMNGQIVFRTRFLK